ncbi:MAG: hypothetical protein JXA57_06580, partial [Armatimonadetes bacterium]|nr:hypothetical protein [Armatimonadota bacterium]
MNLSTVILSREAKTSLTTCLESLREADMLRPSDELVVVDTSVKEDGTRELVEELGGTFVHAPELLFDASGMVAKWLPEWQEMAERSPQVTGGVMSSFADARNIASQKTHNDVNFWIDSDDVLKETKPGALRETIEREWGKKDLSMIFLDYEYAHDELGNPTALLKRERVFDKNLWHWKGACHEVLIPHDSAQIRNIAYFQDLGTRVV